MSATFDVLICCLQVTKADSLFLKLQTDPAANLPFNLKLTDSEKMARSQVKLPYMLGKEEKAAQLDGPPGRGMIFYQPDDADDFDEEDPDDDLDI